MPLASRKYELLWLGGAWLLLLFFYRETFSLGLMHEDFAWALWSNQNGWEEIFRAPTDAYFRPLSVRLPYWVFFRLEHGLWWWKATTFVLIGLGAALLWDWLRALSGAPWAALFAALLWMFSPFQSFGIYYLNAFDYVLFPFALVGFLRALEKNSGRGALIFLWLALLSKELALVFPLLALARPRALSRAWHLALWVSAALGFAWMRSLYSGQGGVGGFALSLVPLSLAKNFGAIAGRTFWLSESGNFSILWFVTAVLFWLTALAVLLRRERKFVVRNFLQLSIFLSPLLLVENMQSRFFGVLLWIFLLELSVRGAPQFLRQRYAPAAFSCAALLFTFFPDPLAKPYARSFVAYEQVQKAAFPLLTHCPRRQPVVLSGLEQVLGNQGYAEYGLWALRWRHPELKFYLLQAADFDPSQVIPAHRAMWVESWRTKGHPEIRFREQQGIEAEGKDSCAENRDS